MPLESKVKVNVNVGCLMGIIGGIVGVVLGAHLVDSGTLYQVPIIGEVAKIDKFLAIGAFTVPFIWVPYWIGAALQRKGYNK